LQVDRCASCAEIKSAFRILAKRFHPDVTRDRDGERQFKDVAEAYRTLKRPDSKVAYDRQINNICDDRFALSISVPGIENFNWGLALFQYYLWFWLNRSEDGE
jgi:curved DNA-binding protein CbpA